MDEYVKVFNSKSGEDYSKENKSSSSKKTYLQLMESDQTSAQPLLTFVGVPKKAVEDTYEVLYDYLIKSLEIANQKHAIELDIDNSQHPTLITAKIIKKVNDSIKKSCEKPDKGVGKNGYTVDLNIFGGSNGAKVGDVSITRGSESYRMVYCDSADTVAKVMNQYIKDLSDEVKKQMKSACTSMWEYFRTTTMIADIQKETLKSSLGDLTDYMLSKGYGNVLRNILSIKTVYDKVKSLSSNLTLINFEKALVNADDSELKELLKIIKNGKVSDKDVKDTAVSYALDKLEKARKNAESALYDYIYDADTLETGENTDWNRLKSFVKGVFQCPVNIDVIDAETQEVVGYVRDGAVYTDGSINITLSDDVKIIELPRDKKYKFDITATGEGTMNVFYENVDQYDEPAYISMYDVPLTQGKKYEQDFDTSKFPESAETLPSLKDDEGIEIKASEYFSNESENRFVTVNVEVPEGGSVLGTGQYTKGDSVMLNSLADDGYKFVGWYENDALINYDGFFRFTAMKDRKITAVFEKIPEEDTNCTWKIEKAYEDEAAFWTYKGKNSCIDIEMSLYSLTDDSSSQITAEMSYKGSKPKTVSVQSEDKLHYYISDLSTKELESLKIYNEKDELIAAMTYELKPEDLKGDFDGDKKVSVADAVILQKFLVKKTKTISGNTDLNGDGKVNVFDFIILKRMILAAK